MQPPNILYVMADQWRASALGYAGNGDVQTPRLDAFAAEAADCHRAIATCPVCTPARASLLTGLEAHRHGLFLNDVPLDPDLPGMEKTFAASGYQTAWVGKWHVDGHGRSTYIPPQRRHGFGHFAVLECTHAYNESRYFLDDDPTPRTWDGYDAQAQTEHLCRWLDRRDPTRPFCAFLSWGPPHNPYQTAPAADRARYDPATITLPPNVPQWAADQARTDLAGYYAHCSALDRCFGCLLDHLEALGCAEDTIVVFTADHGDFIGSHGLWEKQAPWEESIRVPLLIRGAGIPPGRNDTILTLSDHYPTLAGLCGLALPAPVHGRDLTDHLQQATRPPRNQALVASYETFGTWRHRASFPEVDPLFRARVYRGVRDERWLYCEDSDGPWLLYDCDADPYQMVNLIDDPAWQTVRAEQKHQLTQLLEAVEDPFLPPGENAARWGYTFD